LFNQRTNLDPFGILVCAGEVIRLLKLKLLTHLIKDVTANDSFLCNIKIYQMLTLFYISTKYPGSQIMKIKLMHLNNNISMPYANVDALKRISF